MEKPPSSAMLYLFFVGLPLLGLIGVLQLGRGVRATPSIGGKWSVDGRGPLTAAIECRSDDASPGARDPRRWGLDIAQSGPRLTMVLEDGDKAQLRGRLDGAHVVGTTHGKGAPRIEVNAEVNRTARPEELAGTVRFAECAEPATGQTIELPFRAVRERPSGAAGGS
jgi:hypothetical protein